MNLKPASILSRSAVLLDHILASFIGSLLILPFSFFLYNNGFPRKLILLVSLVLLGSINLTYFVFFEGRTSSTPFKKIFGMKVVSENGKEIGFKRSFLRNFFRLIDVSSFYLTGLGVTLTNNDNKRLGDLFADTKVVTENDLEEAVEDSGTKMEIIGYILAVLGFLPMFGIIPTVVGMI